MITDCATMLTNPLLPHRERKVLIPLHSLIVPAVTVFSLHCLPGLCHSRLIRRTGANLDYPGMPGDWANQMSAGPSPEPTDAASAGDETVKHPLHGGSGGFGCSCSIRAPSGGGASWRRLQIRGADKATRYTISGASWLFSAGRWAVPRSGVHAEPTLLKLLEVGVAGLGHRPAQRPEQLLGHRPEQLVAQFLFCCPACQ
jgi:hypothetical protein